MTLQILIGLITGILLATGISLVIARHYNRLMSIEREKLVKAIESLIDEHRES